MGVFFASGDSTMRLIVSVALFLFAGLSVILFGPIPLPFVSLFFCLLFLAIKYPKIALYSLAFYLLFSSLLVTHVGKYTLLGIVLDRVEELLVLICFVGVVSQSMMKRSLVGTPIDWPVSLLVIVAVASSLLNRVVPLKLALYDLILLIKGFLVFYMFYWLDIRENTLKKIIKLFFFAGAGILILGVVNFFFPRQFVNIVHGPLPIHYRAGMPSVQSVFIIPSVFGWFMVTISIFLFSFFVFYEKKRFLLSAFLFAASSLMSMKLRPIMGLVSVVFMATLLVERKKRNGVIFVSLLLFMVFLVVFGANISKVYEDRARDYISGPKISSSARGVLYSTSAIIAKDYFPLGSGLGTYGGWISALYYSPLYAKYGLSNIPGLERNGKFIMDTFWPYLLAQFGVFGLILYLLIIYILFMKMRGLLHSDSLSVFQKAFVLAVALVLVESTVESTAAALFLRPPEYYLIFSGLGIALSFQKRTKMC